MGTIVKWSLVVLVICSLIGACSILAKGFVDYNGQYVPKRPNFKLKDKQGSVIADLDTVAIYKMVEMYDNSELIYPVSDLKDELNSIYNYIKFYSKGRCLIFSIFNKDAFGMPNSLKESDLNPNNKDSNKNYYHSTDGENFQIESFVFGDGKGYYVEIDYVLGDSGNTLIMQEGGIKTVYKKTTIPLSWNTYKVDW